MPVPVLYLITELSTGGAQTALTRLLTRLDRSRFSPAVACLYNGDGAAAQAIRALGVPVTDLGMAAKWRWDALWRLYRLLRCERPAILHTHLFHANIPGRILGRLAGVPVVICTEHTMAMESPWRYRLNRWTDGLADRIVAVSANVRNFCRTHIGLPEEKLVLIPNGVELPELPLPSPQETRAALGLPPEGLLLGTVSRLDPAKGIEVLLEALPQVEDAALVVIGDGPQRAALESLAARLGLSARVYWAGFQPDVTRWLLAFDLFVQPSHYEGLPTTVLEAMAAGLPVVATAVGGTPEVVVDGVTGLLVPPRDSAALAQAIAALLRDPELRGRMGKAGRERVAQHFSVERMVRKTERLYAELLLRQGDKETR